VPGGKWEADVAKLTHIHGQLWEEGDPEDWAPKFIYHGADGPGNTVEAWVEQQVVTPVFGPRIARSIRVVLACLAGPADPAVRNDLHLLAKFEEAGVPRENMTVLLERQCTPTGVTWALDNAVKNTHEGDFLFVYLGGHGKPDNHYSLCTWEGATTADMILKSLSRVDEKVPVFLVIDSCYSGNLNEYLRSEYKGPLPSELHLLHSTQAGTVAYTGWRLIDLLIKHIFPKGAYSNAEGVGKTIAHDFRTENSPNQRAGYNRFGAC
jgi:hypothetical protein